MGKCVKVDLRTAERLGGSIERVGVYHFTGPRILINSPRIYTTSSFPPLLHLFLLLLLLLPKQQTLPQCVPGGLSPQSRQPSWSLPRALRSCRLSLVSLCRPRVLPACSLIREWGGWSEFVCVCVYSVLLDPLLPTHRAAFKDQWFWSIGLATPIPRKVSDDSMDQSVKQAVMSLTVYPYLCVCVRIHMCICVFTRVVKALDKINGQKEKWKSITPWSQCWKSLRVLLTQNHTLEILH